MVAVNFIRLSLQGACATAIGIALQALDASTFPGSFCIEIPTRATCEEAWELWKHLIFGIEDLHHVSVCIVIWSNTVLCWAVDCECLA
jgi:hypothetical protein